MKRKLAQIERKLQIVAMGALLERLGALIELGFGNLRVVISKWYPRFEPRCLFTAFLRSEQ
eukprot:1757893-Amphidinium_carterae.1